MNFASLMNPASPSSATAFPAADLFGSMNAGDEAFFSAEEQRPSTTAFDALTPPAGFAFSGEGPGATAGATEGFPTFTGGSVVAESEEGEGYRGATPGGGVDQMDVDLAPAPLFAFPNFKPAAANSVQLDADSDPGGEARRRLARLQNHGGLVTGGVAVTPSDSGAVSSPDEPLESQKNQGKRQESDVKLEEAEEDAVVDIMALSDNEGALPVAKKLSRSAKPKQTAAQRKASKVKAGKARAALYASNSSRPDSPSSSGAPFSLPHILTNSTAADGQSTASSREGSPGASSGQNSPVPFPFAFPTVIVDAKRTVLPEGVEGMSAPFATYLPPRGTESEDDEHNRGVQRRKGKGRAKERKEEEEEEGDDRLYCVCQELYDPERTMIACDLCEEWYHLECVEIPDAKVDLVDQFVCPNCHKKSSERTTWKACCARPTCLRGVAPLSKYCSDYCGIEVAATRLEISKLSPDKFWSHVVGARRREAQTLDVERPLLPHEPAAIQHEEAEDERALLLLQSRLSDLVARRGVLDGYLSLVHARLRYLRVAIKRWEIFCAQTVEALALAGIDTTKTKSKSKSKKSGGSAVTSHPDAPCGFDVRLVHDSVSWEMWVESEEGRELVGGDEEASNEAAMKEGWEDEAEGNICLLPKKKCERHTGWQKVRQADFEVEAAVLRRRLDRLSSQEQRIRGQMQDHEEASRFRALHRNRTGVAIAVEGRMQVVPTSPPKKSVSRAVGGAAGGVLAKPKAVTNMNGGEYAIPSDLVGYLSRSDQAKWRRQGHL